MHPHLQKKFLRCRFWDIRLPTGSAPYAGVINCCQINNWFSGELNMLNASPPSKIFSTVLFLRYGFQLGAPPTPGYKLLSNEQLILTNSTLGNTSPPSKTILYHAIFEIQLLTWSALYAGDKFFVKKRLILGDLKVLNASQSVTVCMILTRWGIRSSPSWCWGITKSDLAYCLFKYTFCRKQWNFGSGNSGIWIASYIWQFTSGGLVTKI